MRFTKRYSSRELQSKPELIKSDTDEGAGIWCSRLGRYVKPKGWLDGVTKQEAAPDKYTYEPVSPGSVDGY
jgi:hypothetical protein